MSQEGQSYLGELGLVEAEKDGSDLYITSQSPKRLGWNQSWKLKTTTGFVYPWLINRHLQLWPPFFVIGRTCNDRRGIVDAD